MCSHIPPQWPQQSLSHSLHEHNQQKEGTTNKRKAGCTAVTTSHLGSCWEQWQQPSDSSDWCQQIKWYWQFKSCSIVRQLKRCKTCLLSVSAVFLIGRDYFPPFNDNSGIISNDDHWEQKSKIGEKCLRLFSKPNSPEATMTWDSWLETKPTTLKVANSYRQQYPDAVASSSPSLYFSYTWMVCNISDFYSQYSEQCHLSCTNYLLCIRL